MVAVARESGGGRILTLGQLPTTRAGWSAELLSLTFPAIQGPLRALDHIAATTGRGQIAGGILRRLRGSRRGELT